MLKRTLFKCAFKQSRNNVCSANRITQITFFYNLPIDPPVGIDLLLATTREDHKFYTHIDVNSIYFVAVCLWPCLRDKSVELLVLLVPLDSVKGIVSQVVVTLQLGRFPWRAVLRNIYADPFQTTRYGS